MTEKEKQIATATTIAQKLGWTVRIENGKIEFSQYTPANEDFSFEVSADNIAHEVYDYMFGFDVDEHIAMWIRAKENGVSGVPTVSELLEDAQFIQDELKTLSRCISRGELVPEPVQVYLDSILIKHFGCKTPFLKRPRIKERFGGRGNNSYEYLTVAGGKAYGKLVDLVYDLGNLLPDLVDANEIVECLDDIVDSPGY